MVLDPVLKETITRITKALMAFAAKQGWGPGDYRILFNPYSQWAKIRVMFIVKDFAGGGEQEMWNRIDDLIRETLSPMPEPRLRIGLLVRSQAQVAEGGIYRIHEDFIDQQDLLLMPAFAY